MFYGMSCGRRKRKPERLLNILLRACECARVGSMQKVRTKTGKQEVFHKRERQKKGKKCRYGWKKHGRSLHKTGRKKCSGNRKIPEWLIKKQQAASVKRKRFRRKIGMTEEKHGKSLHKTDKKMLRKPKNTGMTNKNTANSIHKTQKIPEKNRDDGEKTRRAPAQDRQKKCSGNRKIPEWLIKNGKWHPQNAKDSG